MKIDKPDNVSEKLLNDVIENSVEFVSILGREKKYAVSWLKHGAKRKITKIILSKGDDDKVSCKCAAAIILNGYFKILFFYWALWRWFYYVKEYGEHELNPIIEVGKKKVPADAYLINTMSLTEMRDTMMMMTRAEVDRFRQGLHLAQHTHSEKNTVGS